MTSTQVASQNKLSAIIGFKKNNQNQDEVNEAFKRINERKKGDGIGSKLLSGLSYSNKGNTSFKALSEKLDHPENFKKPESNGTDNQNSQLNPSNLNNNTDHIDNKETPEVANLAKAVDNLKITEGNSNSNTVNYCKTQNITNMNTNPNKVQVEPRCIKDCDDEKLLKSMKKKSSKLFSKLVQ